MQVTLQRILEAIDDESLPEWIRAAFVRYLDGESLDEGFQVNGKDRRDYWLSLRNEAATELWMAIAEDYDVSNRQAAILAFEAIDGSPLTEDYEDLIDTIILACEHSSPFNHPDSLYSVIWNRAMA